MRAPKLKRLTFWKTEEIGQKCQKGSGPNSSDHHGTFLAAEICFSQEGFLKMEPMMMKEDLLVETIKERDKRRDRD